MQKEEFVKWFSELNKDSGSIAGGKGANLSEIYNLKVQVPPGFVVTAQAYNYFIEKAGLKEKIKEILGNIEYEDTENLNKATQEVREAIIKAELPKEIEEEILESYETLSTDEEIKGNPAVHELLRASSKEEFVAVRSSATTEDLAEASFAGQQDTYLNIKGKSQLLTNIKKCFASLFTPRATYYRNKKGFDHSKASLAVVVQKMIDANKSGVIFSKNPSSGEDIIIEAVWGLGEGIVSGRITPDRYIIEETKNGLEIKEKKIEKKKIAMTRNSSGDGETIRLSEEISERQVLKEHEIKKLAEIALKLEEHYKKPQDIEFAIEHEEIYIVQTRPITTIKSSGNREETKELKGEAILTGLAASPGIASGKVKIIEDLKDLSKIKEGDILVTIMTNPDMVVAMQKSAAIITNEGGMTAHASIVSREMGIPAVVGTQDATEKLKEGEIVTVDGFNGKIYKGKISESVQKEIKPVEAQTKTNLKVIIDLPSFAVRAAKSNIKSVGLARVEGIIAESGKHPNYFLEKDRMEEYEELIFKGISEIAKYFEEIWVRTSDIRSDEFAHLEGSPNNPEANPMLGMHGIRYSLKHPKILKAELNAMKKVSRQGKKIGILTPQIISVEEVKKLKLAIEETEFSDAKIGVMVETPAAVQIIRELCEEKIDFISFGTNDLTQYTLAVDRGNEQVQSLYDEMHPAVLNQIKQVITVCKENNVETSLCGQAGSKKEMVEFLIDCGIDSISVNADVAAELAEHIAEIEKNRQERETHEDQRDEPPSGIEKYNERIPGLEKYKEKIQELEQHREEKQEKNTQYGREEEIQEEPSFPREEPLIETEPYFPPQQEEFPEIKGVVRELENEIENKLEDFSNQEPEIIETIKDKIEQGEEYIKEFIGEIEDKKPNEIQKEKNSENHYGENQEEHLEQHPPEKSEKKEEPEVLDIF